MKFLQLMVATGLLVGPATATVISVSRNAVISAWGVARVATFGQTITAPADSHLINFTFELGTQFIGLGPISYQAHVFAWDQTNTRATGSSLYSSATTVFTAPASGFLPVTFAPDITLVPNEQYVLFFSTSGLQAGEPASNVLWWANNTNPYAGGLFVSQDSFNNTDAWTQSGWNISAAFDSSMTVNFGDAAVPEPSTYGLCGAALAALGLLRGKRISGAKISQRFGAIAARNDK